MMSIYFDILLTPHAGENLKKKKLKKSLIVLSKYILNLPCKEITE